MADPANSSTPQKQDPLPSWGKWLLGLSALLAIILLIWGPTWQTSYLHHQGSSVSQQQIFDDEDEARKTLATIFGGIVVGLGAYFTFRNVRAAERNAKVAEDNVEQSRDKNEKDAALAQRKLNTDRYAAAIAMLSTSGDDHIANRLGGIYLLESLAQDSAEFQSPVMDVLAAYVRDKRPARSAEGNVLSYDKYAVDVEAILTVICRRKVQQDGSLRIDFRNTNLDYCNFTGVILSKVNMSYVVARGIMLNRADLSDANLFRADFSGSFLNDINLSRSRCVYTNLSNTFLRSANFSEAVLNNTDFSQSWLEKAILVDADCDYANFDKCYLWRANLELAMLEAAKNISQDQLDVSRGNPTNIPTGLEPPSDERYIKHFSQ